MLERGLVGVADEAGVGESEGSASELAVREGAMGIVDDAALGAFGGFRSELSLGQAAEWSRSPILDGNGDEPPLRTSRHCYRRYSELLSCRLSAWLDFDFVVH